MESTKPSFSALRVVKGLIKFCARHIELVLVGILIAVAAVQYYLRPQSQSLSEILSSGELRVLIADEPDSQYVFNRQHYGFEYELLAAFADELGVELSLEVVPYGELFALLGSGAGDIAVGGILDSPFVRRVSSPSISWFQAKTTVIYRRGTKRPRRIEDLASEPILTSARYFEIEQLKALNLVDDHRSEYALLSEVDNGGERFVLSTNYRARNAKHYLPNLNRSFILPDSLDVVWVLPTRYDQPLMLRLNAFLRESLEKKLPSRLADDHFRTPALLSTYDALAIHRKIDEILPYFDSAFRKAGRNANIDWQLIAAIAYQESRWSNDVVSPTGVRGLMQLTTDTADSLGVTDRLDMTESIDAAALYLKTLRERLPNKIKEPERTWFAVGAYNIGLKHILAAYSKARTQGLDNTRWSVVSTLLPELYDKPFNRGVQAQNYVERVQIFTDILRFYDNHQRQDSVLERGALAASETP